MDSTLSSGAPTGRGSPQRTFHDIRDREGVLKAIKVREDKPDGTKECKWKRPNGAWGLNGTRPEELPLYGAEKLSDWPEDHPVVVVEGEKAADALNEKGMILALGTVTGASGTPGTEPLEDLRDRDVIIWPDADESGRCHGRRVAERLQGVAASVCVYDWPEAPEKGDAADHPAVIGGSKKDLGILLDDILGAPRWEPKPDGHEQPKALTNPLLADRVLLGEAMEKGIDPPEELEPGILLKGKVHHFFAAAARGKTMLALWLVKRCIERGELVAYFDDENGARTISERLQDMGVDPAEVDQYLYYLPFPNLPMTLEAQRNYKELLEDVRPVLVVFDSWISFLAGAGMSENENTDIQIWCSSYTQTARALGIAVVLLDHVPHEGSRARGASRKRDEADVQWQLFKTKPFDRNSVGEINLHLEKDREAWLEPSVRFSVGGTEDGRLVFERSSGTVEEPDPADGLTPSAHKLLDVLRTRFAETGANASEWARAADVSRVAVYRAKEPLIGRGLIREERKRYYPALEPDDDRGVTPKTSVQRQGVTPQQAASVTHESGLFERRNGDVLHGVTGRNNNKSYSPAESVTTCNTPLKGVTGVTQPTTGSFTHLPYSEIVAELGRPNSGPAKMLDVYLQDPTRQRLRYLTCAVLVARGLPADDWEHHAGAVERSAADPDNHPLGCECGGCL